MPPDPAPDDPHGGFARSLRRALIAGTVLASVIVAAQFLIEGPRTRAIVASRIAGEIAEENRDFCTSLGIRPGTRAFGTCTAELADIRRQHEQRIAGPVGLL
jgi:hypothetical protein